MDKVYIYVVARDLGFAPNPFHGICTLATCKPGIRKAAVPGDWVIGVGGSRLKATGHCIFGMRVTGKITFDNYWFDTRFRDKKPVRNGSRRMLVGDNIYHFRNGWQQADSHHSNPDGSTNYKNLNTDTSSNKVLLSTHFYYFGKTAPLIPSAFLDRIAYRNGRNYRVFGQGECAQLLEWIESVVPNSRNRITGDPFEFARSAMRYAGTGSKLVN